MLTFGLDSEVFFYCLADSFLHTGKKANNNDNGEIYQRKWEIMSFLSVSYKNLYYVNNCQVSKILETGF